MGLSTLSANHDTRLIKHDNTVFKLKLTFTDTAEQGTQIPADLHSEIELAVGAVISMVEKGSALVRIQTEHFLVCPVLKIWKMGKRLGFRLHGEELDVFPMVIHLTFNRGENEERSVAMKSQELSGVQSQKDHLQIMEVSHQQGQTSEQGSVRKSSIQSPRDESHENTDSSQPQRTEGLHQEGEALQQDSDKNQSVQSPGEQSHKSRDSSPKIYFHSKSKSSLRNASHQTAKLRKRPEFRDTNANNCSALVPTRSSPRKVVRRSDVNSKSSSVGISKSATEITPVASKERLQHAVTRSSSVVEGRSQHAVTRSSSVVEGRSQHAVMRSSSVVEGRSQHAVTRSSSVVEGRAQQALSPLASRKLFSNCRGKKVNHSSRQLASQPQPLDYEKTLVENSSLDHEKTLVENSSLGHEKTLVENSSLGHEKALVKNSSLDHEKALVKTSSLNHPTQRQRTVYALRRNINDSIMSEERRLGILASSFNNDSETLKQSSPLDRKRMVQGFHQKDRHLVELADIQEEGKLQLLAACDKDEEETRVRKKRSLVEVFTDNIITPIKRALRQTKV